MGRQKSREELALYIKSGQSLIYVVTYEEAVAMNAVLAVSEQAAKRPDVLSWSSASGICLDKWSLANESESKVIEADVREHMKSIHDIISFLEFARKYSRNAIFVLHDFDKHFEQYAERKNEVIRMLKEISYSSSRMNKEMSRHAIETGVRYRNPAEKQIIIVSSSLSIPKGLEKSTCVLDFSLPDKEDIKKIYKSFRSTLKVFTEGHSDPEVISKACLGLTEEEILNSLAKSFIKNGGRMVVKDLLEEKKQIIRKDGLLEYYDTNVDLKDVGGLQNLKTWVEKAKLGYCDEAKEFGVEEPKGVLLCGIQGCGKSLAVKAIANVLEVPLLKADLGRIYEKWVGESEANIRKMLKMAESIAPCVLWIDEIEKSIQSGTSSSSGTTERVLGTILTWMQERKAPVFVAATANNTENLPPELIRKGRLDEIFFIGLPNYEERKEIIKIHLEKKKRKSENFDIDLIANRLEGFSGSEIEQIVKEAIAQAYFDNKSDITTQDLLQEILKTSPISQTMSEKISKIQNWCKEHKIRPAS